MSESKSPDVSWSDVEKAVLQHYRPELARSIKAALGVMAALSLKGRDHCLVLVFEGGSGRGKSVIVRSIMPQGSETAAFLKRVDDFTPASFVSHASNKSSDDLASIDLLPQLKDKVMLTKELAPLFQDDEKELRQNFARLTSVLDGDGYTTYSGVHGERGYTGRYIFNWLGATTPIPDRTHNVMAQLGNRILFYEVAGEEPSEEELVDFAKNYGGVDAVEDCRKAVGAFVEGYFRRHATNSVEANSIEISSERHLEIIRYAKLIAAGRVVVTDLAGEAQAGLAEGPHRVILLLQTLARGLALLEGRSEVSSDDLEIIRHVALSTIPQRRRELLRALLAKGGRLTSVEVETALDVSRPTALSRMKELGATEICRFSPGNPATSIPAEIALEDDWQWLLDEASGGDDTVTTTERSDRAVATCA
jgi:hypothetical protein